MKTWYLSKTLWLNIIAAVGLLLQTRYGFVMDPEAQTGLLALFNIILRVITKAPLDWSTPAASGDNSDAGFIRPSLLFLIALIAAFACVVTLTGCATTSPTAPPSAKDSPQVLAGKSLLAVKSSILVAATATDNLCKAATMPVDQCLSAKIAYENTKPAYDMALDAYLFMSAGGGDPADFESAILRVKSLAANLLLTVGGAH